ncbi:hypothetical protein RND71_015292 [Anisodus tanguticus]|uniref:Nudix hydrolase domain-containing protein n=1 Tax=Anisodus tanguticus TaxID=243964 RepID=A0AAE1S6M7_9SOLA|nr:hypothetical protein RND71_015292 [Anisodus tanguticus]
MGRPNVGKSALFNRLIRRREALVYNTLTDHGTRDIREGVAKLGNLRFRILDSAGIEAEASSGSVLRRTAEMTGNVLSRTQLALLLVDARLLNRSMTDGTLAAAAGGAYNLGFGDPIALSAETGLGMAELHETLRPLLEEYVVQNNLCDDEIQENDSSEDMESKLPLRLPIVGRPNVGKSTLLNTILQDRVLVGPEAALTRDSIHAEFQYEGRTVYLVDTAGWLERTKQQEKGPASLSNMQSRKHLMRAHVIVLVLDAEEIAKDRRRMKHVEVVIARRSVEEGHGLVVIVNKMDLLRGKENSKFYKSVIEAVPQDIQTVIPQVTGIPVVFVSALEGNTQIAVMNQDQLLPAVNDDHGGVTVVLKEPMDPNIFHNMLKASLSKWMLQGKKDVWIKAPIELVNLAKTAVKKLNDGVITYRAVAKDVLEVEIRKSERKFLFGIYYEKLQPHYLMLVYWIPETENTIPANASHRVGIGAIVLNEKRELPVVQENSSRLKGTAVWKIPTGVVEEGEDIFEGAIREVKEETRICWVPPFQIDMSFWKFLHSSRQTHKAFFGKPDLFFICMMHPLSFDIQKQDLEIEAAQVTSSSPVSCELSSAFKWIRIEGWAHHPRVSKAAIGPKSWLQTNFLIIKNDT